MSERSDVHRWVARARAHLGAQQSRRRAGDRLEVGARKEALQTLVDRLQTPHFVASGVEAVAARQRDLIRIRLKTTNESQYRDLNVETTVAYSCAARRSGVVCEGLGNLVDVAQQVVDALLLVVRHRNRVGRVRRFLQTITP